MSAVTLYLWHVREEDIRIQMTVIAVYVLMDSAVATVNNRHHQPEVSI